MLTDAFSFARPEQRAGVTDAGLEQAAVAGKPVETL
jgi:hypothetical protein